MSSCSEGWRRHFVAGAAPVWSFGGDMYPRFEPFLLRWDTDTSSAGYLGARRWRYRNSDGQPRDDDGTSTVARRLAGDVVLARAPIAVSYPSSAFHLLAHGADADRWLHRDSRVAFDLRGRLELEAFFTDTLAFHAHELSARGVGPERIPPLGREVAYDRFRDALEPLARCDDLACVLASRARAHPSAEAALAKAVDELRALGHDLGSWEPLEHWGWDYVTRRPGRGLTVSLERTESGEVCVDIAFSRRASE